MNRQKLGLRIFTMAVFIMCFSFAALAYAVGPSTDDVVIMTVQQLRDAGVPLPGGTFIENGEALSDDDLIMFNSEIAIAISVGTPNPWGYPPNSILDAALMKGAPVGDDSLLEAAVAGDLYAGTDTIWDMEFLMDNWDSWGPTNSMPRSLAIADDINYDYNDRDGSLKGVVSSRQYSTVDKDPMDVVTYYVLEDGANYLSINTVVTNNGASTYDTSVNTDGEGLSTGYSLGNKGNYMFSPNSNVGSPYGNFSCTYNQDFNVSLIVPEADRNDIWGSSGYKDSEEKTVYEPGGTYQFSAILLLNGEGSLEGTLNHLMMLDEALEGPATVSGTVYDADTEEPIETPIIVVEKDGKTFTWIIGDENGEYNFQLPAIEDMSAYELYALKELYSPSIKQELLSISEDVYSPGDLWMAPTEEITVTVVDDNEDPIDARLVLQDVTIPAVKYVAQVVFYTDLENVGVATIPVVAGEVTIEVSSGKNFVSNPVMLDVNTEETLDYEVMIDTLIDPAADNWYSADMHHHSNKSDGSTLPSNLVRSQMANRLNAIVVSDHDSIASSPEIAEYATARSVVFLPSLEVSPSWAHFGVFAVTDDGYEKLSTDDFSVDTAMDFSDMIEKVHDNGMVMVANHGYIAYGLFTALGSDAIPGGYNEDFDLIEINGGIKVAQNKSALNKAMDLWTASLDGGKIYYLTGGSDVHDVLSPSSLSGAARTYVYSEDDLTWESYMDALLAGNAYVTMGPILWADDLLGATVKVTKGDDFSMDFATMAVNGIAKVEIFTEGKIVAESMTFDEPSMDQEELSFEFSPATDTWYSIVVTDGAGKQAFSNPVWIDVVSATSGGGGGSSTAGEKVTTTARHALAFKAGVKNMAYVHGYPDKTFRPNGAVTRAEVMAMFYNLLDNSTFSANGSYTDLQNVAWARQAILTLSNEGIVGGYPDGSFKPGQPMTRGEFAAVVAKIMGLDADGAMVTGQLRDVSNHWAEKSIYLLLANGYIAGYPDGSFKPNASLTRAEAVVIINRIIESAGIGSAQTSPFTDLNKSHWAYMEIMKAVYGK